MRLCSNLVLPVLVEVHQGSLRHILQLAVHYDNCPKEIDVANLPQCLLQASTVEPERQLKPARQMP
jgi:hypothetical protein